MAFSCCKTSYNSLLDKPFYEKVHREEVVAPTTFTMDEGSAYGDYYKMDLGQNSGYVLAEFMVSDDFEIGNSFVVVYDGVEYVCPVYQGDGPGIGNSLLWDLNEEEANGEPFYLTKYYSQRLIFTTEPGEHTIAIYTQSTEIKTIDPKFLPGGGSGKPWVVTEHRTDDCLEVESYSANFTVDELAAAIDAGNMPNVVLHILNYSMNNGEFVSNKVCPVSYMDHYKGPDGSIWFDLSFNPPGDQERLMVYTSDGELFNDV